MCQKREENLFLSVKINQQTDCKLQQEENYVFSDLFDIFKNYLAKGPYFYYVRKVVGGWVQQNAYNCLGAVHKLRKGTRVGRWFHQILIFPY